MEARRIGRKDSRIPTLVLASVMGVAALAAVLVIGFGDFSTTTTTESVIGTVIDSDNSFSILNSGVSIATNQISGSATNTEPKDIGPSNPVFRTNEVTRGHFVYMLEPEEASDPSSGTWTVRILHDGNQMGNTLTITQSTATQSTEGATMPDSNVFEARITKTG